VHRTRKRFVEAEVYGKKVSIIMVSAVLLPFGNSGKIA